MSRKIDEVKQRLAEVEADVVKFAENQEEIDGDVQEVLDKINSTPGDGMTGPETDEVLALVGALKEKTGAAASRSREIADKVPEAPESA